MKIAKYFKLRRLPYKSRSQRSFLDSSETFIDNRSRSLAMNRTKETANNSNIINQSEVKKENNERSNISRIAYQRESERIAKVSKEQIDNIRLLKRKVNNIVKNHSRNVCEHFESKNILFNDKFMSYVQGPVLYDKMNKYQTHLHFHKVNDIEDKKTKVIDFDKIKYEILSPSEILKRTLSQDEIDIIGQEPIYFMKHLSNKMQGVKIIKTRKLVERLRDEENERKRKKLKISMDDILIQSKVKSLELQKNNFTNKIDEAFNATKRKLYKAKSKELNETIRKNKSASDLREEIHKEIIKNELDRYIEELNLGFEPPLKYSCNIKKKDMRVGLIANNKERLDNEANLNMFIPLHTKQQNEENKFLKNICKKIRMSFFSRFNKVIPKSKSTKQL